MNYFVDRDELLYEIAKAVDSIFTAIVKTRTERDNVLSKKLKDLRNEFLLILDAIGYESYPAKNKKGDKKMSKVKTLIDQLWILGEKLDNKELLDIAKGLEEYVGKTGSDLKKFRGELKGLLERVKVLEEQKEVNIE